MRTNVFALLNVPFPRAHRLMADLMCLWNRVLDEPIPDDMRELLDKLK